MNNKRLCRKTIWTRRINVIFNSIDWILFLGFSILAAHFMIGVIDQYQEKTTSFSQSLEPITKMPTIVMCIEGDQITNYKREVKLDYYAEARYVLKRENIKEQRRYVLTDARNETFQVLQVMDKCIMMESNLTLPYKSGTRKIVLKFHKNMTAVHFYFTSQENSLGSVFRQWWDGQVLDIVVNAGRMATVSIQPSEKRYLNFDNQCSYTSHLRKWMPTIPTFNFTKCPNKCSPTTFFSHLLPLCGWKEQMEPRVNTCARNTLRWYLRKFTADIGYKRPCNILEYQGYKTYEEKKANNKIVTLEHHLF